MTTTTTTTMTKRLETDKEESEGEEDINNIENFNNNMVTPMKKNNSPAKAATSTTKAKKIKSSKVDSIAKGINGISIGTTNLYSVNSFDPIFIRPRVAIKEYLEVKDYIEVDIKVGQPITEEFISVTLSPNGQHIFYKKPGHPQNVWRDWYYEGGIGTEVQS